MTALDHALAYAAAGYPVFPCKATSDKERGSKAPHLPGESEKDAKDGGHWLASVDRAKLGGWWAKWPDALIGFPTGLRSRCIVVDLDPRKVPAPVMLKALTAWCGRLRFENPETGEVTEPAIAVTQSGGLHLYFAWPDEALFEVVAGNLTRLGKPVSGTIGNKTNLFSAFLKVGECPPELAHIDVRGEGGYVIAPPSVMSDGNRYAWLIERGETLPPLPPRLRGVITGEFITDQEKRERRARREARPDHRSSDISDRRVAEYVDGAVKWSLDFARSAPEGERNANVFKAASNLSRFIRSGHLDFSRAESLLLANLPAGVSPGEHKIRKTILNGLNATEREVFDPRQIGTGRAA